MLLYILSIGLSAAVAFLRGGNLRSIPDFNGLWIPVVALALQLTVILVPGTLLGFVIMGISYTMLLVFLAWNRKHSGFRLILLGTLLNFLVIGLNGGRMPVLEGAAIQAQVDIQDIAHGQAAKHALMDSRTRLGFLGDVIAVPPPIRKVISIGDVIVIVGCFLLVQDVMGRRVKSLEPGESR